MAEVATTVDWSKATMTPMAANTKNPGMRVNVVRVPRKLLDKYWPLPWSAVERAGADGVDGCELYVVMGTEAPAGSAYLREGLRSDHGLKGMSLLFHQNW